jgi:hypothetical protein
MCGNIGRHIITYVQVRSKLDAARLKIATLGRTKADLDALIPAGFVASSSSSSSGGSSSEAETLRAALKKV